jgi:ATP-dependent Clp protease ATP-binding subunit ClpA
MHSKGVFDTTNDRLRPKRNPILQGPGVGKTFVARPLACAPMSMEADKPLMCFPLVTTDALTTTGMAGSINE